MLSAYPTKHARIGNAVGLDTPAATVAPAGRAARARLRHRPDDGPARCPASPTSDGDALIHALIAAGGQDQDWLTEEQLAGNPVRIAAAGYRAWFDDAAGRPARRRSSSTGARRPASCSSTAPATRRRDRARRAARPATSW